MNPRLWHLAYPGLRNTCRSPLRSVRRQVQAFEQGTMMRRLTPSTGLSSLTVAEPFVRRWPRMASTAFA